ncbi:MAG: hypothetical protein GF309_09855 [Candidatus Lokiarchaeota archaeon]|nr:hypothetical protein [Candidatus Lokiarchaeota archaeon]
MLAKRRNVRILLPLMVAVIAISFLVAPVAASFGGSDTPAFAAGETLGGHFAESGVDLTDGECTIRQIRHMSRVLRQ